MNFRFGTVLVLGTALFVGGCASSGETRSPAGSESSVMSTGAEGDGLPEWVESLPEGVEPRDNDHTAQATLYLLQAQSASSEELAVSRYEEALGHARAGIEADPDNPQSHFQLGEALLGLGRLDEAAAAFDRAEELYPRYIIETIGLREMAWIEQYNEGVDLVEQEDMEGAIENFKRADRIYPYRPEAVLNLASAFAQMGRYEESEAAFARVLEVVDSEWADRVDEEVQETWRGVRVPALENRAQLLLRLERYAEAAELFGDLIETDPDNLGYLTSYASALVASGQGADAQDLFDDLLSRDGLDAADYFTIGVGLYQVDEYQGAAAAFRMAYEAVPNHRDAVFNLAQTLYLLGREGGQSDSWPELAEVSAKLLEIDVMNPLAYQFRANALLEIGEGDAAMEIYTTGQDLPIIMDELVLQPSGGDVVLAGQLSNHSGGAGAEVRLRFHFYDLNGTEVGTRETTVRFENEGEARAFQVELPGDNVYGYSYRVLD
jgi:tetratricopeptide (TPR) repeat protein